jgi:hypothetical protein
MSIRTATYVFILSVCSIILYSGFILILEGNNSGLLSFLVSVPMMSLATWMFFTE